MCNCVLLGVYRYNNAGEAAWLIKPFDKRVSTYIRRTVKPGCRRPKEFQSKIKEFVCNQIFLIQVHLQQSQVDFTEVDKR